MRENKAFIFQRFPALDGKLPWIPLGEFPTRVEPLKVLGQKLGLSQLWIKREDLSSTDYGGNKVRKLEFLLADARARGRDAVLTLGAAGSNHVLATTVHARSLSLKSLAVMIPQPVQEYARNNLLSNFNLGCEIHYVQRELAVPWAVIKTYFSHWVKKQNHRPYFIWAGGSSPLGTLGYVNCGLEIADQVRKGELPDPDYIFCAVGSCGTFAGLWLGCKLAGLKAQVVGVRVYEYLGANEYMAAHLARSALGLIRGHDRSIPAVKINHGQFHILHQYCGGGYAHFTRRGVEAIRLAFELENIKLEGTYTGKAFAGLMGFAKESELGDEVLLFINTYNSSDLSRFVNINPDYRRLPESLHHYFEKKVADTEEG
jgi:1-aminocyclopropane-1-carboxylate deaminase/D-cysteine desulfhydrase-like pyridoxal-dependent ACC family enzyme